MDAVKSKQPHFRAPFLKKTESLFLSDLFLSKKNNLAMRFFHTILFHLQQSTDYTAPERSPLPVASAGRKISQYVMSKFSRNKSAGEAPQTNHVTLELGSPVASQKDIDQKSSKSGGDRASYSTRKGSEPMQRRLSFVSIKVTCTHNLSCARACSKLMV